MTSSKRNLILGFCTGYRFKAIESFIASVLNISDTVQLCLFTHGLDKKFENVAAQHSILVEDASPFLDLGFHPQNARYFAYQQFLHKNRNAYDRVLLTDVRDVFFQSDPFSVRHPKSICFSLEDTKIMWETINQGWIRDIYGDDLLADISKNHVACSGTTLGTTAGIENYLDIICTELLNRSFDRTQVYDQGIHNYIVWKLRPDWGWVDETDLVVNTVGCTGPERISVIDDLVVIDGTIPPVVHQWDRHASLRTHVETSDRFRLKSKLFAICAPRDSPVMIPRVPPIGPALGELVEFGEARDSIKIEEGGSVVRTSFFYSAFPLGECALYGKTFSDLNFRSYHCTRFEAHRFDALTLIGSDGIVLHASKTIPDTLMHITNWASGSSTESFLNRTYLCLRADMEVSTVFESGVCIGFCPSWRNYAHWMQQSLPKLFAFLYLQKRMPDLKIVLPRFEPGSFQEQTINLLGIAPTTHVIVDDHQAIQFNDVWITSEADIWTIPPLVPIAAAKIVAAVAARLPKPETCGHRVYIHRITGTRRVRNLGSVKTVLDNYGFHVVSFEDSPVATQVAIMQDARYVIGEHGASLANIMFCRPGTSVLELFNPANVQPAYWSLASVSRLNFGYLVGTHAADDEAGEADWNSPYDIPVDRLEEAIRRMLGLSPAVQSPLDPRTLSRPDVNFIDQGVFEVGGVRFAIAGIQTPKDEQCVLINKDRSFIDSYIETLPELSVSRAFEFGIYQGGNAIFLTKLLRLEKFVCVDISDSIDAFQTVLSKTGLDGKIKAYFNTPQDSTDRIRDIFEAEFATDPVDLIIDDASHQYELTKQSFQIAFPYLKVGGYYIIEDWSWAHWPENQSETNSWKAQPALTNLILELVVLLPSSDFIEWIMVRQGYVIIKKKASRHKASLLNIGDALRTRGKPIVKI